MNFTFWTAPRRPEKKILCIWNYFKKYGVGIGKRFYLRKKDCSVYRRFNFFHYSAVCGAKNACKNLTFFDWLIRFCKFLKNAGGFWFDANHRAFINYRRNVALGWKFEDLVFVKKIEYMLHCIVGTFLVDGFCLVGKNWIRFGFPNLPVVVQGCCVIRMWLSKDDIWKTEGFCAFNVFVSCGHDADVGNKFSGDVIAGKLNSIFVAAYLWKNARSYRMTKDGESTENRYFITSLKDVKLAAKAMRAQY